MKNDFDVIVVGGGPAGMGAAIGASNTGASVLIVERDDNLGGILNQCIHSGFGIHYFGEELTGPEYAYRLEQELKNKNITVWLQSFVTEIEKNKVTIINDKGCQVLSAGAVVLAMGCRERTAGAVFLTGSRPTGIYTAGQVQKMVNFYGKLPCKEPVILGSGDIGLIMARRLTFEGAKPKMVLEIMPTSSGLPRNISQCLEDFDIPLITSTTIVDVLGETRVEGVIIAEVDKNFNIIEESKKKIKCDAVILSVGLIPENDLVKTIRFNPKTNGAIVNEYRETDMSGVFSCGNVLHVHDLVDYVSKEALEVGGFAGLHAQNKLKRSKEHEVICGSGVRYMIPNRVYEGKGSVNILFRVTGRFEKSNIIVKCNGEVLAKKFVIAANAGEMQEIAVPKEKIDNSLEVSMEKLV